MNDLIKILENDSRNKLTFLFEPVTTDSGTLAVESPDQLINNQALNNPELRQNFINAIKKVLGNVDTRVANQWFDTLIKEIRTISLENFKNTTEYKTIEWGLELLNDGIESKLKQLIYNRSNRPMIEIDIDKLKKLVKIFMDALREPVSFGGIKEIIKSPIFTRVVDELDTLGINVAPLYQELPTQVDLDTATREFDEMYGSRIYRNTVIKIGPFKIEEVPRDADILDDEPPDPDDPNPVTEYDLTYKKKTVRRDIRVIALLITLISTVTGATIKIVKTIKDEHKKDKKDDTPTSTTGIPNDTSRKEEPKPKKEEPSPKPEDTYVRPKRTKRHGDLP
jgi:hypothetical protein